MRMRVVRDAAKFSAILRGLSVAAWIICDGIPSHRLSRLFQDATPLLFDRRLKRLCGDIVAVQHSQAPFFTHYLLHSHHTHRKKNLYIPFYRTL